MRPRWPRQNSGSNIGFDGATLPVGIQRPQVASRFEGIAVFGISPSAHDRLAPLDRTTEFDVTRANRAWRKANGYVRSGHHAKAIEWFSRTLEILDSGPPRPHRINGIDLGYVAGALVVLVALWVAAGS